MSAEIMNATDGILTLKVAGKIDNPNLPPPRPESGLANINVNHTCETILDRVAYRITTESF